jgi:hypothetical protein
MPVSSVISGGIGAAGAVGAAAIQANEAATAAANQLAAAKAVTAQANQAATTATGDVNAGTATANTGLSTGEAAGNQVIAGTLTAQQAALAPYLQAGTTSLSGLQSDLTGLTNPANAFSFNPATSPQLQFEQQQAQQALQRQSAAQGTVLGGGTVRASDIMNTGLASTYLNQAFNQALSQYNTNRQNTLTQIQGLQNITSLGYNAAGAENQDIGNAGLQTNTNIQNVSGQQAANTIGAATYAGNTGLTAAQIGASALTGAANAQSASDIATGKAWGGAAQSLAGTAGNLYGLSQAPGPSASSQPGWTGTAAPPPGGYGSSATSLYS